MSVQELACLRLASQAISRPQSEQPLEILRRLVAIQGQDYGHAKWAIGLRSAVNEQQIEALIEQTQIVRTWLMRGTLHMLALSDLRWMLGLFAERLLQSLANITKRLGGERYQRLHALMQAALDEQQRSGKVELHRAWIVGLLREYYDPMYAYQRAQKDSRIEFAGERQAVLEYLRERSRRRQ